MADFLMRSCMFVPAHNQKFLNSSLRRDADVLLLDIEDSVPPGEKQKARDNIKEFVRRNDIGRKRIFPRVNDRESGELLKDVSQLTISGVSGFMYPKAEKAEDVYFICKLLETLEYEKKLPIGTFKVIPLIETPGAVVNIDQICRVSSRVIAVAFGCEDYLTNLQGLHDATGESISFARNMVSNAARAAGIEPIDTIHIRIHDLEDLERNLRFARSLGFGGMLVLNPVELPLVNQCFSPSLEEVRWAEDVVRLSSIALREGNGVALKDGKFIGPPIVKRARDILSKSALISQES